MVENPENLIPVIADGGGRYHHRAYRGNEAYLPIYSDNQKVWEKKPELRSIPELRYL